MPCETAHVKKIAICRPEGNYTNTAHRVKVAFIDVPPATRPAESTGPFWLARGQDGELDPMFDQGLRERAGPTAVSGSHIPSGSRWNRILKSSMPQITGYACHWYWPEANHVVVCLAIAQPWPENFSRFAGRHPEPFHKRGRVGLQPVHERRPKSKLMLS
jgi:hypothetical protein